MKNHFDVLGLKSASVCQTRATALSTELQQIELADYEFCPSFFFRNIIKINFSTERTVIVHCRTQVLIKHTVDSFEQTDSLFVDQKEQVNNNIDYSP